MYLSAGAVGKYGLEQLGAEEKCASAAKGKDEIHSINREFHTHSREGSQTHTFTSSITLIHTFRFTKKREKSLELSRGLGAVLGTSLLPSSSSSPLFILSMYFLFSVFIVMFN